MPGGRPTTYTKDLASIMCARIAEGESVRSICRDDEMPAISTFFKWIGEHEEFSKQYAIAKDQCIEVYFDEMVDISDNQVGSPAKDEDGNLLTDKDGNLVKFVDGASVGHAKLRVDTRKWALSKMCPKKYGDKIQQEVSGPDGGPVTMVERRIVKASD